MPPTPSGLRIANRPTTLPVNDPGSDAAAPAFEISGMLRAQSSVLRCRQFYPTAEPMRQNILLYLREAGCIKLQYLSSQKHGRKPGAKRFPCHASLKIPALESS